MLTSWRVSVDHTQCVISVVMSWRHFTVSLLNKGAGYEADQADRSATDCGDSAAEHVGEDADDGRAEEDHPHGQGTHPCCRRHREKMEKKRWVNVKKQDAEQWYKLQNRCKWQNNRRLLLIAMHSLGEIGCLKHVISFLFYFLAIQWPRAGRGAAGMQTEWTGRKYQKNTWGWSTTQSAHSSWRQHLTATSHLLPQKWRPWQQTTQIMTLWAFKKSLPEKGSV